MLTSSKNKPMEILLVEDGWTDARATIYSLRRSHVHHRLTLVRSVAEANAFIARAGIFARAPRPDLMLLDMMLPDGEGLEVVDTMRANVPDDPEYSEPTIVVLTASADPGLRQRCDDLDVHDFISKPVREEDFLRVIRDHKKLMIHTTPVLEPALG